MFLKLGFGLLCIALTGCSFIKRITEDPYKHYAITDLANDKSPSAYQELVAQLQKDSVQILPEKCFAIPVAHTDVAECGKRRNTAISALIVNSEKLCVDHRKSIYGNEALVNITAGSFTNLFSGLATAVPEASLKTTFSALSLFSNAERSLVNETVYKTALVTAVDAKIVQHRNELAHGLYEKFNQDITKYSADQAIHDIMVFHYSCSFMDGLRLALEEGTQERPKQKIIRLKENLRQINNEILQLNMNKSDTPGQPESSAKNEKQPKPNTQKSQTTNKQQQAQPAIQKLELKPEVSTMTDIYKAGLQGRMDAIQEELKKLETE